MLRGVFADGGTASGRDRGYDMAGKTGTANIAIDGHYSDSAYVASFIGMVPTDLPGSSWRSWSTSPRDRSSVGRWRHRRSSRSSAGRCRTSGSRRGALDPARRRAGRLQDREAVVPLGAYRGHPIDGV